jgi:polar amino acid transport system substrate-binding protein
MSKLNRWMFPLMAALAGALLLASLASPAAAESTLERIERQGYVRVAFANEAPFGYATSSGKLTGEAPEIAKAVFAKMGVKQVDGVLTEWASLIPGLRAGRFDMIAAGMFVNPKRCAQVAFSEPTYTLGQSFLVRNGNPHDLHSYSDVKKDSGIKLGVMAGAVERGYARDADIPDSQIVELPDQASMLAAVRAGRVDAAALTALSIQRMAEKGGAKVERAEPFMTPKAAEGSGAFAFRKEDASLRNEFNEYLTEFVGSPEHLKLVKPFGFTKNELPQQATAELCSGK